MGPVIWTKPTACRPPTSAARSRKPSAIGSARSLGALTRHLLLMTATPHNGNEEDFQLFLALLDGDRFEGGSATASSRRPVRPHAAAGQGEPAQFDGTPLFPERQRVHGHYALSDGEAVLYKAGHRLRPRGDEPGRALAEGEGSKGTVGFALTFCNVAWHPRPEAIYQSLQRRRERLEKRLARSSCSARRGTSARCEGRRCRSRRLTTSTTWTTHGRRARGARGASSSMRRRPPAPSPSSKPRSPA